MWTQRGMERLGSVERVALRHVHYRVKQTADGNLPYDTGSPARCYDDLECWDGVAGREVQERGTHLYLWLLHVDVWQRPTQHYEAIYPPTTNKYIQRENVVYTHTMEYYPALKKKETLPLATTAVS